MGKWRFVLSGKNLDYWRRTEWRLEDVSLLPETFEPGIVNAIAGILKAHIGGERIEYSNVVDGKEKLFRLIRFIKENGVVPVPVVLLDQRANFKMLDGCHRIAALTYLRLHAKKPESESAIIASNFTPPAELQSAWIATAPSEGTYEPDPIIAEEGAEIQRQWDSIPPRRPLSLPGFPKRPK